jgi:hypothetical protein
MNEIAFGNFGCTKARSSITSERSFRQVVRGLVIKAGEARQSSCDLFHSVVFKPEHSLDVNAKLTKVFSQSVEDKLLGVWRSEEAIIGLRKLREQGDSSFGITAGDCDPR